MTSMHMFLIFLLFNSLPAFKSREAAKREATEAAKQYNYNYGDGGVLDQTSAEFKTMSDSMKAAKKEAVETAKKYNYRYTGA